MTLKTHVKYALLPIAVVVGLGGWLYSKYRSDSLSYAFVIEDLQSDGLEVYNEAKHTFMKTAVDVGGQVAIIDKKDFLGFQVAMFRGNSRKLILHISGTHGVEGYIGSHIQSSILSNYSHDPNGPTVVFVHGLNPYGMIHYRRFNENGVDLNRNAIFTPYTLESMNRNKYGSDTYQLVRDTINPIGQIYDGQWTRVKQYLRMVYFIIKNGFGTSKKAIVTGTYDPYDKGKLVWGGDKLQPSHQLLHGYLEKTVNPESVSDVVVIDVHSGLGPEGKDTLMIPWCTTKSREEMEDIYGHDSYKIDMVGDKVVSTTSKGYDEVYGTVDEGYANLFSFANNVTAITQEFGTYSPLRVMMELILENQYKNYGGQYDNRKLYEIFSPMWKKEYLNEIERRGRRVFENALRSM